MLRKHLAKDRAQLAKNLQAAAALLPLSKHDAVRAAKLPEPGAVNTPDDLPSVIGPIQLRPSNALEQDLQAALQDRCRDAEAVLHVLADVDVAVATARGACADLDGRLNILAAHNSTISAAASVASASVPVFEQAQSAAAAALSAAAAGSGLEPLISTPTASPSPTFSFRLPESCVRTDSVRLCLDGIAHELYRGSRFQQELLLQLERLQGGLAILWPRERRPSEPQADGAIAVPGLRRDALERSRALHFSHQLLSGALSPADWAAKAVAVPVEPLVPQQEPSGDQDHDAEDTGDDGASYVTDALDGEHSGPTFDLPQEDDEAPGADL